MKKFKELKKYQKQRIFFLFFVVFLIIAIIVVSISIKDNSHTDIDDIKKAQISSDTVVFLGSDFTRGTKAGHKSFVDYFNDEFDANILSITGTHLKMVGKNKNDISYLSLFDSISNDDKKPRAVFCEISYFDAKKKSKIGSLSSSKNDEDFDLKTIYGVMEHIAYQCKEIYGCPLVFYTTPFCDSRQYEKLIFAAQEVADKWGAEIYDFYYDGAFHFNKAQNKKYMANKYCPSKDGYNEVFNPSFAQLIYNNYPDILDKEFSPF